MSSVVYASFPEHSPKDNFSRAVALKVNSPVFRFLKWQIRFLRCSNFKFCDLRWCVQNMRKQLETVKTWQLSQVWSRFSAYMHSFVLLVFTCFCAFFTVFSVFRNFWHQKLCFPWNSAPWLKLIVRHDFQRSVVWHICKHSRSPFFCRWLQTLEK